MVTFHNRQQLMKQEKVRKQLEFEKKQNELLKQQQKRNRDNLSKLSSSIAISSAINNRKTIKEKEKAKRMKGQSSHATWKPEAFMLLRQQFD